MIVVRPHALEGCMLFNILGAPKLCLRVGLAKELSDLTPDYWDAAEAAIEAAFGMQLSLQGQAGHSCFGYPLDGWVWIKWSANCVFTVLAPKGLSPSAHWIQIRFLEERHDFYPVSCEVRCRSRGQEF
jgi:hypothetical protein